MTELLKGLAPWPVGDFSAFGPVEIGDLSRPQRFVAAAMGRNWIAIPHVTHHDDADVTRLEQVRAAYNAGNERRLTVVPFVVKALAAAMRAFPQFNVSLDPDAGKVIHKDFVHIGVAVDTPRGLLVPVIRDGDRKSVEEIAEEISHLSEKARAKGLSMNEMQGACTTLTSLGHIGGTGFTPIVNAPEVAILGIARVRPVPRPAPDGGVDWRQMLPLSLSYDHRVVNGADAARFCRHLADTLAAPAAFGPSRHPEP